MVASDSEEIYSPVALPGPPLDADTPIGGGINLNLLAFPSLGDFLPPARTIGEDSVCLLPPGASGLPTGWQGIERPVLDGKVDLITGMPLARATDLELAFGGATFRLTRTRSGDHPWQRLGIPGTSSAYQPFGRGKWWDWLGSGWMVGENPILLIDSALPDLVGNNPRTTWLVLDAHRSIPFQLIESTGQYEAPPRFRARLEHNGSGWGPQQVPNPANPSEPLVRRGWTVQPTEYRVSLYDGQLTYVFVAVRDDVPPNRPAVNYLSNPFDPTLVGLDHLTSYHDRPYLFDQFPSETWHFENHYSYSPAANPGFGIPHYGLCTRIVDRYGHTVEIEYCQPKRWAVDDPATEDCVECASNCLARGQISHIKLRRPDGDVLWTLVYAHAYLPATTSFDPPDYHPGHPSNIPLRDLEAEVVIDRIYVYEGEIADAVLDGACLTSVWHGPECYHGELDPLTEFNSSGGNLPLNWLHQIRYHYSYSFDNDRPVRPALMLKSTVRTRSESEVGAVETVRRKVYRYRLQHGEGAFGGGPINFLELVFEDHDIARILSSAEALGLPQPGSWTVDNIVFFTAPEGGGWFDEEILRRNATIRLEPAVLFWPQYDNPYAPPDASVVTPVFQGRPYVSGVSLDRLTNAGSLTQVGAVSFRDADGRERHYRLNYLAVLPIGETPPYGEFHRDALDIYDSQRDFRPTRSVFAHPYQWQSCRTSLLDQGYWPLSGPIGRNLAETRFIAMIDEFSEGDALRSTGVYSSSYYSASNGVKAGQVSRRVVQMNPAGFTLVDRLWQFVGNDAVVGGGGLAEEYVYMRAEDYFASVGSPLPPPPAPPGPPPPPPEEPAAPAVDRYTSIRGELLLVEHRSIGWSAADNALNGAGEGLIRFFDFKLELDPDPEVPARTQMVAEGVKKGTSGAKLYTRQRLTDESDPNVAVDCNIEFVNPQWQALTTFPQLTLPNPQDLIPWQATYSVTFRLDDPLTPPLERRVISRMTVGPPRKVRPDSGWYFPVEREFYDEFGNPTWSATGLVLNPFDPYGQGGHVPHESLTFTYYVRDYEGRAVATVVDAAPGNYLGPEWESSLQPVTVTAFPGSGWQRIPDASAQSHPVFITQFRYNAWGLSDTFLPNGRRWARRIVMIDPPGAGPGPVSDDQKVAREYIFNDLVFVDEEFRALSPGEVKTYAGRQPVGSPMTNEKVVFDTFANLDFSDEGTAPAYEVDWTVRIAVDANGRPTTAELLERDPTGALLPVGSQEINDLGEVYREREIDGTITRRTRNPTGHTLRTYRGTIDTGWQDQQSGPTNNMVLVERVEYGGDPSNAWLPKVVRSYRSNPSWAMQYYDAPPSPDPDGIATVMGYDWRMRPVRTDSYAKGDPFDSSPPARLSTTLTFLDHADRPVLIATYGAGAPASFPAGIEPTTLEPEDPLPTARDLFDAIPRPVSLVEMKYGPDGTLIERRTYDMAWIPPVGDPVAQPDYLAEIQYSGHGGKEIYSQRPGQPLRITRLDSLGRVMESASILPDATGEYELTRTDYIYDADGNVVETLSWERVLHDSVERLSTANAVRSRTVNWYDVQKRLIATAELGTELADGYVAGAAADPFTRGAAPTWTEGGGGEIVIVWPGGSAPPEGSPVRIYEYDGRGNQVRTIEPTGGPGKYLATEFEYTPTGRLTKKTENSEDANPNLHKSTLYSHQYGRLISIEAASTKVPLAGKPQETKVVYGAEIVDAGFSVVSLNNGLVGKVRFPDETTGEPSAADDVMSIRYNFAGQVAERTDARGVTFRYEYDALGRLSSVEVGHYSGGSFLPIYPPSMKPASGAPVDRIGFVQYAYTSAGHLYTVTTYGKRGDGVIITLNRFDTDARGNLYREWQSYGETVSAYTPKIVYNWAYEPTGASPEQPGHLRLASMIYPAHSGAASRTVSMSYGTTGSADERLSRLAAITTNLGVAPTIAQFSYVGTSRRESLWLAGGGSTGIYQSLRLGNEVGLLALDTFGRLRDLHYRDGSGGTLYRAEYGYDHAGNRLRALLTMASVNGSSRSNTDSQLNTYDNLGRLIGTDVGALVQDPYSHEWSIDPNARKRTDSWRLDLLGNWVGGAAAGITGPPAPLPDAGRLTVLPGGAASGITHAVNATNEITGITLDTINGAGGTPGQQQVETRYDAAGNLIFDGEYFYQYDAWNRLVQVNEASLNGSGEIVAGALLKHHTYDGLGRLARTQSPWPDPQTAAGGEVRSERFYYDGIRRIQEVVSDPVKVLNLALGSEDPQLQLLAMQSVEPGADMDGDAAPMALETGQLEGMGGDPPIGGPPTVTRMSREYIWGPGDNGIDELLVQFDPQRLPTWPLQDAGGDIVALCSAGGGSGTAAVLGQWTYDAYGAVLTADQIYAFPHLHLGHKAMFLDRLDAGVLASGVESQRLVPYAHAVYQYRNRAYSPALGRFFQRDPNATAAVLLESSSYHGRGMGALVAAFDLMEMYGDGANLYQYLGSNPWQRRDPLGLSWDPFSVVEDYLTEFTGNAAAMLSSLGQNLTAVAIVGANIASMLPFPFAGNLGDLALYALGEQSEASLAAAMAIGIIPGGKLASKFASSGIGRFIGRVGASAWGAAKHYAGKAGTWLARRIYRDGGPGFSLLDDAAEFLRKGCGCFEAGTQVWTERGLVPIEEVRDGDLVWAQNELTGERELRQVVGVFARPGAPIVEVLVASADGRTQTLRTTEEHPFWTPDLGWAVAQGLRPGAALRTEAGEAVVVGVRFTTERRTVYNFEVEGLHSYLVGEDGVLVHNGKPDCFHDLPEFFTRNFTNPGKIEYHWNKHAKKYGKSLEEYMNDALSFFAENKHKGEWIPTEVGQGLRIRNPGHPGGIFSADGRIITFWYE